MEQKEKALRRQGGGNTIICPHCKHETNAGNFCSLCGKRIVETCNCHLLGKPYNCGRSKCPNMDEITILLIKIHKDQKRRKYIFLAPVFECLEYISRNAIQKFCTNKSSVFGTRGFDQEIWYKLY